MIDIIRTDFHRAALHSRIFDEVSEAIIGTDPDGTIVFCNRAVEAIFGWADSELIGRNLNVLIPERARKVHPSHMVRFQKDGLKSAYMGKASNTIRGLHKDGHEVALDTTLLKMDMQEGEAYYVAVVRDISERTAYLSEFERLASTDELTGLINRRHFMERLSGLIGNKDDKRSVVWLAVLDLDGFSGVNDVYGYAAGDLLLAEVSRRIQQSLPAEGIAARMGADEFGFALPQDHEAFDINELGERVTQSIRKPFSIEGTEISVGISAGFARFPDVAQTAGSLLERAEFSLATAKRTCKGSFSVYSSASETAVQKNARIEFCLRTCDIDKEFYLEFQPIVDLRTNAITHFEALARWNSPELGKVSPADFIPVAERCGRIRQLTKILFDKALVAAARWPETVSLSFNLSAQDILSPGNVLRLLATMLQSPVAPDRVEFEITETSILTDFDQAEMALKSLVGCGSRIALDDFGNGYSSYGYIDRLPLHKIKIDRSFITRLNTGPTALKVIKGIADFAANLELDCVAEGIETVSDLEKIRNAGVPFAQGFVFSRPVPATEIPALLKSNTGKAP